MIFLNNFLVIFTGRSFCNALFACTSYIVNSTKKDVLQRLFHLKNFSTMLENYGFCFQDCVSLLQHLGDNRELSHGKSLHSFCIKTGFDRDVFVQNNMIRFYRVCGDLVNARLLFDDMPEPNLVSWTSMVSSYVHDGQFEIGLSMYSLMCRSGLRPNEFGFSVALKACRIMHEYVMGMLIHGQILKCGFESYSFCSAPILGLYAEFGDIENAHKFFVGIPLRGRSEASWNTLLDGYVQISNAEKAVELFHQMMHSNLSPNCHTYTILVKLCASVLNLMLGRLFHGQIIKVGFENDVIVGGVLVDTYVKLGFLDDACKLFQNLEEKDNVVWCALLVGLHHIGDSKQGLNFYLEFLFEGNKPDPFIYACLFSLCWNVETGNAGSQIHCTFIKYGFKMDSFMGSALIEMYGSIGMFSDAYKCFLEVGNKNEICFSAMINISVSYSYDETALELFSEMMNRGLAPSHSTISYVVRACANLHILKEGRSLHSHIVKNLSDADFSLCMGNALVEMYTKCGEVDAAKLVFKGMTMQNEFSWTTILSGCCELGRFEEALELFRDMLLSSVSTKPSQYTVVIVVQACTKLEELDKGKQVHCYGVKAGFESHPFVESALINMYATFKHEVQNAFLVFSSMNEQDLVCWSTMITACAQNGYKEEALKLFSEFQTTPSFLADESILSSCLSACAGLAALDMGKRFHAYIVKTGFASHLHVASSIIDMYSKCGSIKDAHKFFYEMENHNLVSWTAMMSGYAHNGLGKEALEAFKEMKEAGLEPDGVTFLGVLTACSHAGLVKEGWQHFESMRNDYGLEVTVNHYSCFIDLLGRAEKVDEAEALIKKAPFDAKSKSLLWKTLLGACNKHGNVEVGKRIAQMLVELEPNDPSIYVLLSNIYASVSMWDNSTEMRNKMKGDNITKLPGRSWIQVES